MSLRGRNVWPLLLAAAVAGALPGCGEESADEPYLFATAHWERDPGRVSDLGYGVRADVGWAAGQDGCAQIPPALRMKVNDLEAEKVFVGGECGNQLFAAGPFTDPGPVTIRAFDGDRLIGEATFAGLFGGAGAALLFPSDGVVQQGDAVTFSIVSGPPPPPNLQFVRFYWLDPVPPVPPFNTVADATVAPDALSATVTVPVMADVFGRAALVLEHLETQTLTPSHLRGFGNAWLSEDVVTGPIFLDVLPAPTTQLPEPPAQ